jgi:hypothetical protein
VSRTTEPTAATEHAVDAPIYEEILVSGEQPGPGLWRVSRGEHSLWILGTQGPLPKKMSWRSRDVEALLAQSQEILLDGGLEQRPDIGFLRGVLLLPSLFGAARNPDDKKLQDVLPAELHAQWLLLKEKYLGRDRGVERWRPTFAVAKLRSEAIKKSGLTNASVTRRLIDRARKKYKIKVTTPRVVQKISVEKPRAVLKKFASMPLADVECFARSIERLETDLEQMRARANAWAIGDIDALRKLTDSNREQSCVAALVNAVLNGDLAQELGVEDTVQSLLQDSQRGEQELQRLWLEAAEGALASNKTTFAVLSMSQILSEQGYVAQLRQRGYAVEEP